MNLIAQLIIGFLITLFLQEMFKQSGEQDKPAYWRRIEYDSLAQAVKEKTDAQFRIREWKKTKRGKF